jgi:sterol desaturase/sphingolipid hydroxylase (fatty acid hydroxylase superfamily)
MNSPFAIRTISYLAMLAAMLFFERMAPYARSEQKKGDRIVFHLGLSIGNSIVLYLIMTWPIFASLSFSGNYYLGVRHLLGIYGPWEILATVIAFDFWDYWMHLANHKIGFLWRFHQAHHSDMEIDVTTAARFHVGELVISGISKCLMLLVWGPSLWGLVTFDLLLNMASQFHHSNLGISQKIQDGLEKIIVTPRMHRCHHSLHQDCYDTNFSTILSVWDRLFKSYHWAREAIELVPIGLYKIRGPETMQLKPFLRTPFRVGK